MMAPSKDQPATVRLRLDSSPETLTLVRGAIGGLAEQLALDVELLDDLKTAVSEACNNVVMHAYGGESGPLSVRLYVGEDEIEVSVRDQGRGIPMQAPADDRLQGVGDPDHAGPGRADRGSVRSSTGARRSGCSSRAAVTASSCTPRPASPQPRTVGSITCRETRSCRSLR